MKYRFILLVLLLAAALPALANAEPYAERTLYKSALADLSQGRTSAFRRKQAQLEGYALAPYLEYRSMLRSISRVSLDDLEQFEATYPGLPAARFLRRSYLKRQAERRASKRFLAAYPENDDIYGAGLRCFRARALNATGRQEEAFALAETLWVVGRSQDKACDPIFDIWRKSDAFTEQVVWRRLQLAVEAGQTQLARYLVRYLTGSRKARGEALISVHTSPGLIRRTGSYRHDTVEGRYVVLHGLARLARRNPGQAHDAWQTYSQTLTFSDAEIEAARRVVLLAEAKEGRYPTAGFASEDAELLVDLARAAVREANFSQVERLVELLPTEERHKPEWQYWLARALIANHGENERATLTLEALAQDRHYYGFLAADALNVTPLLNDTSQPVDESVLKSLAEVPGVARAIELFAVGDRTNAIREWNQALEDASSEQERRLLGYAAYHLGELRLAISTANRADLNDEVAIRFPIAFTQQFRSAAAETAMPLPLLLAVTRQESAFDRRARSSANARGLMQMLPSTARVVAGRLRESAPATSALYQSDTNTRLGAHYLAWLGQRFDGQTPLMAAGYNAGEHRVDRWIKEAGGLAMDVWIERIPFRETRNYVKNVVAFQQVYAQRLNLPRQPTLKPHERKVLTR